MKKILCITFCLSLLLCMLSGCTTVIVEDSYLSDEIVYISKPADTQNSSVVDINQNNSSANESDMSDNQSDTNDSSANESNTSDNQSNTNPSSATEACWHEYDDGKIQKTAELFNAGEKLYTCTKCGDTYTNSYPVETLKVLAIGNSYSVNALLRFPQICKQAGVKEIVVATMFIPDCSLDKHWTNIQNNSSTYQLYRSDIGGKWDIIDNYSIDKIIHEEDWDVVTLQNSSGNTGQADAFGNLDNMVNYVKQECPDAKIMWHMTWAYQGTFNDGRFYPYDYDQMNMYKAIMDCTQNIVMKNKDICAVIPVGTAIQNIRSSYIGDTVNDDGLHLTPDIGYDLAGLTWYQALTGQLVYDFQYNSAYSKTNKNMEVILQSVSDAFKKPYELTMSSHQNFVQ